MPLWAALGGLSGLYDMKLGERHGMSSEVGEGKEEGNMIKIN